MQSDVTQTCWAMTVPLWVVLEDLEAQTQHRTCSWTLGTRAEGSELPLAALPVFCFTLIMTHASLERRSVFNVEEKSGNVVRMGSGLGRK